MQRVWGIRLGMARRRVGSGRIKSGTVVRFPQGGIQTIRVQTREDGVSIGEIVLSAREHKTQRVQVQ